MRHAVQRHIAARQQAGLPQLRLQPAGGAGGVAPAQQATRQAVNAGALHVCLSRVATLAAQACAREAEQLCAARALTSPPGHACPGSGCAACRCAWPCGSQVARRRGGCASSEEGRGRCKLKRSGRGSARGRDAPPPRVRPARCPHLLCRQKQQWRPQRQPPAWSSTVGYSLKRALRSRSARRQASRLSAFAARWRRLRSTVRAASQRERSSGLSAAAGGSARSRRARRRWQYSLRGRWGGRERA